MSDLHAELTLLHRQLKALEQTYSSELDNLNDAGAYIEEALASLSMALTDIDENYVDPDELPGDTLDQHQATELWFKRRI